MRAIKEVIITYPVDENRKNLVQGCLAVPQPYLFQYGYQFDIPFAVSEVFM